ncbi:MAG: class I mannose-6-phosphate isomerase [Phycisphaerae bacterium]|nr:class I mannose-6-phosphate isomerase [Phycisphaerae bacterium]
MPQHDPSPCPLCFRPMLLEKVWGGDRLSTFGKPVAPGAAIGESWEVADLGATSASGAGGAAARSVIEGGTMHGRTLADALGAWGPALLGHAGADSFPLLVKYLDANENLSVQVHPSPGYAAANPGSHLKTECWYVLDARPGSVIYKGLRPGVTAERFASLVRAGSAEIVECLQRAPAIAGECHLLPSGTVHALGAGVLVAEVQTPSDTTFRLYDWGRQGRALHVDQALACADLGPAPAATRFAGGPGWNRLVRTDFFTLDEARPEPGSALAVDPLSRCAVLMVLRGAGALHWPGGHMSIAAGRTVVVPACLSAASAVSAGAGLTVLRAVVGGDA